MNKKGQLANSVSELAPFAIAFGLAVVIGSIITLVASSIDTSLSDTDSENFTEQENVSEYGLTGLVNISTQWGTIGTVGGVLILLVMVLGIFGVRRLKG